MLFGSLERQEHPELIKKYLGSVVPTADNYFAALNRPVCCFACVFQFQPFDGVRPCVS